VRHDVDVAPDAGGRQDSAVISWSSAKNIVILTGAGISVASGLRPYRGPGGLWNDVDVETVANAEAIRRDPDRVWGFFETARRAIAEARPNPAHDALARLEASLRPGQSFLLITQNIDGLHQAAGSRRAIELHGTLRRTRCTLCKYERDEALAASTPTAPRCPDCGAALRPDVVLFDEPLSVDVEYAAKRALRDCDLFVAVGTSGTVSPASSFVRSARYAGARTVLVNLEPMSPRNPEFQEELLGRAEELLPVLVPA